MGIERTHRAIEKAHIVLHIVSAENPIFEDVTLRNDQHYIRIINKIDTITSSDTLSSTPALLISAKQDIGIAELRDMLCKTTDTSQLGSGSVVVSNMRHYSALDKAYVALSTALSAMDGNTPTDLLSDDIRQILHHLGEITGEITTTDILQNIFSHFCIGK